jgi:hypothetical protein
VAPLSTRSASLVLAAAVLAGCAGTDGLVEGPVPTVPEPAPPDVADVPTLGPAAPAGTPAGPGAPTPDVPTPDAAAGTSAPTVAAPSPAGPPPTVAPAALDVAGLVAVLAEDPDRAGPRGRELLRELERVADQPTRQRIDRAVERTRGWLDAGDLDPEVARAALAALDLARDEQDPDEDGDQDPDQDADQDRDEDDDD